ncbi:MAG: hypothetical protein H0V20_00170 [Actinobacteria bacterium]|nr:hypothetical protein [Actinomycetota bacterium]
MKTRISFTIVLGVLLLALLAGAAKAKPGTPPPNVAGTTSEPPAAWFQANGRAAWFAYSSFCWTTACVDFLPPARRTDLPRASLSPGQVLSIHLGFIPRSILARNLTTKASYPLVALRDTAWRVRGSGIVLIEARAAKGSASYLVRIAG